MMVFCYLTVLKFDCIPTVVLLVEEREEARYLFSLSLSSPQWGFSVPTLFAGAMQVGKLTLPYS